MRKAAKAFRNWLVLKRYRRFLKAGRNFSCGRGTLFFAPDGITLGDNVYIGRYCTIECNAEIGNDVLIANNVGLVGRRDHDLFEVGVTIRFARSVRDRYQGDVDSSRRADRDKIVIGDDVWLGYGAIVLSGVTIGSGAIVGAGAVISKDIEPFAIVCGVPGRVVGTRFRGDERDRHIQTCRERFNAHQSSKLTTCD